MEQLKNFFDQNLAAVVMALGVVVLSVYMLVQQHRRFCRKKEHDALEAFKDRAAIAREMFLFEDPFLYRLGLELALFKTYSIPTISKILHASQEFATRCLKRYDDTDLIIRTLIEEGLDSNRGKLALGRLNHIHGLFPISNDDYLYTLAAFVLEPPRIFEQLGWRRFSRKEQEATFHWWTETAAGMGITDLPKSIEELVVFRDDYEAKVQRFNPSNKLVALPTLDLMLGQVPAAFKWLAKEAVMGILEPKLVSSLGFERTLFASAFMGPLAKSFLLLRAYAIRFFGLPLTIARRRTPPGAPTSKQAGTTEDSESLIPNFNVYGAAYPNGYRITELGPAKAEKGKVGEVPPRR